MMTLEGGMGLKMMPENIIANRKAFLMRNGWSETSGGFFRVRLDRRYFMPESSICFLSKDDFIFSVRFPEKTWV